MARRTCHAFSNDVAQQRLGRSAEVGLSVLPIAKRPLRRRLPERSSIRADEHRCERSGNESEIETPSLDRRIVRSPRKVPEHRFDARHNGRARLERDPICKAGRGQTLCCFSEPRIPLTIAEEPGPLVKDYGSIASGRTSPFD